MSGHKQDFPKKKGSVSKHDEMNRRVVEKRQRRMQTLALPGVVASHLDLPFVLTLSKQLIRHAQSGRSHLRPAMQTAFSRQPLPGERKTNEVKSQPH